MMVKSYPLFPVLFPLTPWILGRCWWISSLTVPSLLVNHPPDDLLSFSVLSDSASMTPGLHILRIPVPLVPHLRIRLVYTPNYCQGGVGFS